MGHAHNELRVRKFQIMGRIVAVNTNPRPQIGFRATFKGEAGKWGDSKISWEEAVGNLFLNWAAKERKD